MGQGLAKEEGGWEGDWNRGGRRGKGDEPGVV